MAQRIGIGRKQIAWNSVIINYDEMKYPVQTVNLIAGLNTLVTAITTKIYNVFLLDSSGNNITSQVDVNVSSVGGVYEVYITSGIGLNNVEILILY